jgi:hypothetical protein
LICCNGAAGWTGRKKAPALYMYKIDNFAPLFLCLLYEATQVF